MDNRRPQLFGERELLKGFPAFWMGQLEAAREAKAPFSKIAEICDSFYKKSSGFMWEKKFKEDHLKDVDVPKFTVTLQKAFELVAIFGPYLYWQNPFRRVYPREAMEIPPELFVDPNDPNSQMEYEQLAQMQAQKGMESEFRAKLMERYLNYSQEEQPGGLARNCLYMINEALIKGRGCLWPEKYNFPGDDRSFTGIFHDSVDNLFIDPDCNDPELKSAKWIARKHVNPYWEVEARFNLPKDSLKGKGQSESNAHRGADKQSRGRGGRERNNEINDIVVWYEIFSKMGSGTRSSSFDSLLKDGLEDIAGDYVYLCVTDSLDHPLNLTPDDLHTDVEEVAEKLVWPVPSYADHRWPVALLDFYPDTGGCWPIAPLGPALGELIAMNIILSSFIENAYENRKTIVAIVEDKVDELDAAFKSTKSTEYIKFRRDLNENIGQMVNILQRPAMNHDPLKALEYLMASFDKRTGLSEHMYAMSSTQSRSARDVAAKEEKSAIRPEKMAKDVAATITEASQIEKLIAVLEIEGRDLVSLLGPLGAAAWDKLISSQDILEVVREMTATVSASDVRKPNKARDTENIQAAAAWVLPMLQTYASLTTNSDPLNAFVETLGDATEMSTKAWKMGPWSPPSPPPEVQEQQQAMVDLEMGEKQTDIEKTQAETQKILSDIGQSNGDPESEAATRQMEFEFSVAEKERELLQRQAEEEHKQAMIEDSHVQSLSQKDELHRQQITQKETEAMQKLATQNYESQLKMESFRQEAKVREQRNKGLPS